MRFGTMKEVWYFSKWPPDFKDAVLDSLPESCVDDFISLSYKLCHDSPRSTRSDQATSTLPRQRKNSRLSFARFRRRSLPANFFSSKEPESPEDTTPINEPTTPSIGHFLVPNGNGAPSENSREPCCFDIRFSESQMPEIKIRRGRPRDIKQHSLPWRNKKRQPRSSITCGRSYVRIEMSESDPEPDPDFGPKPVRETNVDEVLGYRFQQEPQPTEDFRKSLVRGFWSNSAETSPARTPYYSCPYRQFDRAPPQVPEPPKPISTPSSLARQRQSLIEVQLSPRTGRRIANDSDFSRVLGGNPSPVHVPDALRPQSQSAQFASDYYTLRTHAVPLTQRLSHPLTSSRPPSFASHANDGKSENADSPGCSRKHIANPDSGISDVNSEGSGSKPEEWSENACNSANSRNSQIASIHIPVLASRALPGLMCSESGIRLVRNTTNFELAQQRSNSVTVPAILDSERSSRTSHFASQKNAAKFRQREDSNATSDAGLTALQDAQDNSSRGSERNLLREEISVTPYRHKVANRDSFDSVGQCANSASTSVPCTLSDSSRRGHNRPFDVVVAIDFGTACSGYAYSFSDGRDHICTMRKPDGGDPGVVNHKCPTCLLLQPDGKFHSFGYAARDFYHDLDIQEARKYYYFERFKMSLHLEKLNVESQIIAANSRSRPAIEVFAHSLRYFKHLALGELSDLSGTVVCARDIQWVVTVPAIWRQEAKQLMRQAAYKAGIVNPWNPYQLVIALEPEAAALYCLHIQTHQVVTTPLECAPEIKNGLQPLGRGSYKQRSKSEPGVRAVQLKPGDSYLVIDCGGGTVDITAHELNQDGSSLKEIYRATGGPFGSSSVDVAFESFLADLFGAEFLTHFKSKYPASYVDLLVAFEARKRCTNPYKQSPLNIALPFSFVECYRKVKGHKIDCAMKKIGGNRVSWTPQGMLRISSEMMQSLFQPTLAGIERCISHVLAALYNSGPPKYIFLVGGFAESGMVQQHVRKIFGDKIKVIIPQDVSLAVLKGATLFGLHPDAITVRRSRLTYGVGVLHRFDESCHPADKRITKNGIDWCTDIFDPFVTMGQSTSKGDSVTRLYCPASPTQREIVIQIYCCENESPKFVTDPGTRKCGVLRLILPPVTDDGQRREIAASMKFGETELDVLAIDKRTGASVHCEVDFLGIKR